MDTPTYPIFDLYGLLYDLLFLVMIGVPLYFAPCIIACLKWHRQRVPIFLLNLLLGWTFIGWVAALVWAFLKPPPSNSLTTPDAWEDLQATLPRRLRGAQALPPPRPAVRRPTYHA